VQICAVEVFRSAQEVYSVKSFYLSAPAPRPCMICFWANR
jgi:hypothetical protein